MLINNHKLYITQSSPKNTAFYPVHNHIVQTANQKRCLEAVCFTGFKHRLNYLYNRIFMTIQRNQIKQKSINRRCIPNFAAPNFFNHSA